MHPVEIVAHQGGWDEFLYVAVPIVVVFALLRLANTRAKAIEKARSGDSSADAGASRSD